MLVTLAIGCRPAHTPARQVATDTSAAVQPPQPVDAHVTPLVSAPAPTIGAFDVTGYFFPDSAFILEGQKLNWIEVVGRAASLRFESAANENVFGDAPCPTAIISRDTLDLTCPSTIMGQVRIAGTFLDKRGGYDTLPDVNENTVVMRAQISVRSRTGAVVTRTLRFRFWIGD